MTDAMDFETRLAIANLRRKPTSFRWLWQHYADVQALMRGRVKQAHGGSPVWANLASLSGLSADHLRLAWPKVHALWLKSDPMLHGALSGELGRADPLTIPESKSLTRSHVALDENEFSLPDISGKKI